MSNCLANFVILEHPVYSHVTSQLGQFSLTKQGLVLGGKAFISFVDKCVDGG